MPQSATVTTGTRTDTVEPGQPIKRGANRVTTADQDSGRISVDPFGGLRVRAGGRLIGPRELGGTKPRHVLLALLLHRGAPVSKDRLISVLWGASPPSCATATLEGYVCVLRKKLQPAQTVRASLISTVAGHYAIDMGRVDLDLVRYEHLVSAALDPATSPADALPDAAAGDVTRRVPSAAGGDRQRMAGRCARHPQRERPQEPDRRGQQGRGTAVG